MHCIALQLFVKCLSNRNRITFLHLTASEFFNAIKIIAVALVETGHVITCPLAFAPTSCVERTANIFIVTGFITVGMILRTAALPMVNVRQECWIITLKSKTIQVIPSRAKHPDINSEKHIISF